MKNNVMFSQITVVAVILAVQRVMGAPVSTRLAIAVADILESPLDFYINATEFKKAEQFIAEIPDPDNVFGLPIESLKKNTKARQLMLAAAKLIMHEQAPNF